MTSTIAIVDAKRALVDWLTESSSSVLRSRHARASPQTTTLEIRRQTEHFAGMCTNDGSMLADCKQKERKCGACKQRVLDADVIAQAKRILAMRNQAAAAV
jgi:hypothetical protein